MDYLLFWTYQTYPNVSDDIIQVVANFNPTYFVHDVLKTVHKLIAKWTCHSLDLTMFGKNVLYNWMKSVVLVPITGLAEVVD